MRKRSNKFIFALGLMAAAIAMTPQPASAQYYDNAGTPYNNMESATLGTMINGNLNMMLARQSLYRAMRRSGRSAPAAPDPQEQRGRALIRNKQATMTFTTREFPLNKWLKIWGAGDPQKQDKAAREWAAQKALWASEMQARSAKPGNMADMMALAFVSCMEGYTGERINNAGFHYMSDEFRKTWMKDAGYQGRTAVSKQELYEDALLSGSYSLYLRRTAQKTGDTSELAKGKESAARFLDQWWTGKTGGAIKDLARYSGKSVPNTPAAPAPAAQTIASTPTPKTPVEEPQTSAISFEEAVRVTNYTPVAPILIDEKFATISKDEKTREFITKLVRQLVDKAHSDLRASATSNLPPDNVARAMASSLTICHQIALARPGELIGRGPSPFNREQMQGLRRQVAFVLANDPNFQKLGDREKQEMSETFLMLPLLSATLYNAAATKGDEKAKEAARDFARNTFKGILGVEPEKVYFSAEGVAFH